MRTADRTNYTQGDLKVLRQQYDIIDEGINKHIKSLGSESGLKLPEYPRRPGYKILDFICKSNITKISGEIIGKEKQLINAVEAYLKIYCYESYLKNNLEEIFEKVREDDYYRLETLEIIDRFTFK